MNWLEAMAKNLKLHRLSFMEERAILTFVTASKSLDEIAVRLNRRPDMIVRKARKLGISFDAVVAAQEPVRIVGTPFVPNVNPRER